MKRYLVGYDIRCSRRRQKALKRLRCGSASYQKSVFEISARPAQLRQLMDDLNSLIDPHEDGLFCVHIKNASAAWQLGSGDFLLPQEVLLIQ